MYGLRYRDADGTSVKRDVDGEATASSSVPSTTRVEAATRRQAAKQHRAGTTLAAERRDTREVIRAPGKQRAAIWVVIFHLFRYDPVCPLGL